MRRQHGVRRSSGALFLLTTLFVGSAGLRVVGGADAGSGAALQLLLPAPADASEDDRPADADQALPDVIAALQAREAGLEQRERALEERQRALSIAQEEVRKNLAALAEAEAALRDTIALADGAAQEDLD